MNFGRNLFQKFSSFGEIREHNFMVDFNHQVTDISRSISNGKKIVFAIFFQCIWIGIVDTSSNKLKIAFENISLIENIVFVMLMC